MFSFSSGCYSVSYQDILKHGLWDDSTKSNSSKLFFFFKDYGRYSVNITVYRLQTDRFVSFSSDVL